MNRTKPRTRPWSNRAKLVAQALDLMAYYGEDCELLRGIVTDLLGTKEWYWHCEIFQIGLKELGLA